MSTDNRTAPTVRTGNRISPMARKAAKDATMAPAPAPTMDEDTAPALATETVAPVATVPAPVAVEPVITPSIEAAAPAPNPGGGVTSATHAPMASPTAVPVAGRGRRTMAYALAPYCARGSVGGVHFARNTTMPQAAKPGSWVATVAILCSAPEGCPLSVLDKCGKGDSTLGVLAWLAAGMGWGVGTYPGGNIYLHDGRGIDGKGQGLTTGSPVAHPGAIPLTLITAYYSHAGLPVPASYQAAAPGTGPVYQEPGQGATTAG